MKNMKINYNYKINLLNRILLQQDINLLNSINHWKDSIELDLIHKCCNEMNLSRLCNALLMCKLLKLINLFNLFILYIRMFHHRLIHIPHQSDIQLLYNILSHINNIVLGPIHISCMMLDLNKHCSAQGLCRL